MEYRDRTRIVAPDGEDDAAESPPRVRRLPFAKAAGRLDLRKVATASTLAALLIALIFYAGGLALRSAVGWLHAQPQYQLPFTRITLSTPPPECFRGGATAFLDRVRRNANEPETLSLLDVDPDRLADAFKQFPWVERVESIEFPPRGLVVRLAYRTPVARVQASPADQVILDREGCILPVEDIDTERVGRLIVIRYKGMKLPSADRVGKLWQTGGTDDPARADLDRDVVQAAKLAGFLLQPERESVAKAEPAARVRTILPDDSGFNRGLFVHTSLQTFILWGRGPGYEQAGEPQAEEKWGILVKWAKSGELKASRDGDFWTINRTGMTYTPAARTGRS